MIIKVDVAADQFEKLNEAYAKRTLVGFVRYQNGIADAKRLAAADAAPPPSG